MRLSPSYIIPTIAGLSATAVSLLASIGEQNAMAEEAADATRLETAVFAGGCFWCVEADFDKVDGVIDTLSGYSGGYVEDPTYKQVTHGDTGHLESVRVTYDPSVVSYGQLVEYFLHHIDPTNDQGQFCDKGPSYRTAIFVEGVEERGIARAEINEAEISGRLPGPVVTQVLDSGPFYPAEGYHQDYYQKNPTKYNYYRRACGRDKRVKALWGDAES